MSFEIGSEFWSIPIAQNNNMFEKNTNWFLSGRVALQAIIMENNFRTAALPDWCCDSMIEPFIDSGIKVFFYPALQLSENIKDIHTDAILVMDYFGYTSNTDLTKFDGVIIRDVTHSLFSATYNDSHYYFGSLRKWAGFWTGGFAQGLKKEVKYETYSSPFSLLRQEAMALKAAYIDGKIKDKSFLSVFEAAENELVGAGIIAADARDIEKAKMLDKEFIVSRRRENAKILLREFSDIAIFPTFKDSDCPMFVPIRVKFRDELRKFLIQHQIYCPIHWPKSIYHNLEREAEELYSEELSLVCDQRYMPEDMYRITETIKEFIAQRG